MCKDILFFIECAYLPRQLPAIFASTVEFDAEDRGDTRNPKKYLFVDNNRKVKTFSRKPTFMLIELLLLAVLFIVIIFGINKFVKWYLLQEFKAEYQRRH
jgi:hypothetical protein